MSGKLRPPLGEVCFWVLVNVLLLSRPCNCKLSSNFDELDYGSSDSASFVEEKIKLLRNKVRHERNLLESPVVPTTNLPFEASSDFYFYKSFNVDSGNSDQLVITSVVVESNGSRLPDIEYRDVDILHLDDFKYLWVTTESGLRVTSYDPSAARTSFRPRTIALRGVIATEPLLMTEANLHSGRVAVFILQEQGQIKRLVWYTWNNRDGRLFRQGFYDVNGFTTNIKAIQIPSTDGYVIAALQVNSVAMYDVRFEKGETHVRMCNRLEAFGVSDVEYFSINGQLYVVVANGQAKMSFVWKYHTQKEEFIFHHSLEEEYITSLKYFRRGFEHNLAVISSNGASIYRWEGARLFRIQRLDTTLDRQPSIWHVINSANDGLILLIRPGRTECFSWNKFWNQFVKTEDPECIGWRQVDKEKGVLMPLGAPNSDLQTAQEECVTMRSTCVGVSQTPSGWQIVQRSDSAEIITGRGLRKLSQPGARCWNEALNAPVKAVSFAVTERVIKLFVMNKHNLMSFWLYLGSTQMKESSRKETPDVKLLKVALERQESTLKSVMRTLSDVKLKRQKGSLLKYEADTCNGMKQRMERLEMRLRNCSSKLSNMDSQRLGTVHLEGVKKFGTIYANTLEVHGNAKIKMVNELDIQEFFNDTVLKSVPTEIGGTKTFLGGVTVKGPLEVTGTLNGHRIHKDFILLNRPQRVNGTLKFLAPVFVKNDVDIEHDVNGIRLSTQAVLLNSPEWQHLSGPKIFSSNLVAKECYINGVVNGINVSRLAADLVLSSKKGQVITGQKTFSKVNFAGKVEVEHINGINLGRLADTTVKINAPASITAPKVFTQNVRVTGRLSAESINGINIPHDVVKKSEPVVLLGTKTFLGKLRIGGDLRINGSLGGVNLSDLMYTKGDQALCGRKTFIAQTKFHDFKMKDKEGDVNATLAVIHGNLEILRSVNNWPMETLLQDFVFKNEKHLDFTGPVSFLRPQIFKDVEITGRVNGYHLVEDFVHMSTPNFVTGRKVFEKRLVFERNLKLDGPLDGIDLGTFANDVVKLSDGPQTIRGVKTFLDAVSVETATQIRNEDFLTFKEPLVVKTLNVKGEVIVNSGMVNDVNFKALDKNRITLSTEQEIMGSAWLVGSSKVGELHVSGRLNDANISSLWDDVLWKKSTVKQVITGRKEFKGQVTIQNLEAVEGINGISLRDVKNRALFLDTTRHQKKYTFIDGIRVEGPLIVRGKVNGVQFNDSFAKSTAKKANKGLVRGFKEFEELHVKGNVAVLGLLNGLKLQRDVLTVNTAQNVTGVFTFGRDLITQDVVKVMGLWSSKGVEVVHLTGEVIVENLLTGGDLNGINFAHLWADSALDSQELVIIKGRKNFTGMTTFASNLELNGDVNGFDYPRHFKTIVTTDEHNQVITASKEFKEDVSFLSNVTWTGNVKFKGFFNDVNVTHVKEMSFANSSISTDTLILPGSLKILGNLYTTGTLNGINPTDIVTLNDTSLIQAEKTAQEIYVKGEIRAQQVNGWNLAELEADTLKSTGFQYVTGRKTFLGDVNIGHLQLKEHKGQADLVSKTHLAPLLPDVADRHSLVFNGNVNFSRGLTIIGNLNKDASEKLKMGPSVCQWNECEVLRSLQMQMLEMATSLNSFHSFHVEHGSFANAVVEVVQSESFVHVVFGYADCKTPLRLYIWNPLKEEFFFKGSVNMYAVRNMKTLVYQGQGHLIVNHVSCETGLNYTTIISPEWKSQIRIKQPETVLYVDTLPRGSNTLVASINSANKLKISKIDAGFHHVRLGEVSLPAGSHVCKLPTSTMDSKRLHVAVGVAHAEVFLYVVDLVHPKISLAGTLKAPELLDVSAVHYGLERTLAVIVKGVVKVYSLLDQGHAVVFVQLETIGKMNDWPLSLSSLELHDKSYLMVQSTNAVEIFVKEGASSFVSKATILQRSLKSVRYFTSNDLIYAVVITNHRWNTYMSVMKGGPVPSFKQLNCSLTHP